jgi:hypothetical protein
MGEKGDVVLNSETFLEVMDEDEVVNEDLQTSS